MGRGLSTSSNAVVSAFHSALDKQAVIALGIILAVLVATNIVRARRLSAARLRGPAAAAPARSPEALARRLLRYGFGALWLLDGLLQLQSQMPLGMISQVVKPAAAGSPGFVHVLVNAGATIWNDHPVTAAAAAVWIQLGIGAWLVIAPRGLWSRLGGGASVAWGLLVWIFGEAFGGIFAPGATFMFGTPGGVLFYCVAGVLIAVPEEAFSSPKLGRWLLGGLGVFFAGMGVLQAWPGRGFWQGRHGAIASMTSSMATTPQPGLFASMIRWFTSVADHAGFAVNLVVVVALLSIGAALVSGRPRVARPAVVAAAVLCVADWVLVQDLGFFGGVGTDPNSMIPILLLVVAGYVALVRPAEAVVPEPSSAEPAPGRVLARGAFPLTALGAAGAAAIVTLGALPMAVAALSPGADAILTEAVNGDPIATNTQAPGFHLFDQHGRPTSLASLGGKVIALTFLDPVCTSDCPLIASELRQTDQSLGSAAGGVDFVAVASNPIYHTDAYTEAFDRTEGMSRLSNWIYLSGPVRSLRKTWNAYGVTVAVEPAGSMIAHPDIVYLIDHGRIREILNSDPGSASAALQSSFTTLLGQKIRALESGR